VLTLSRLFIKTVFSKKGLQIVLFLLQRSKSHHQIKQTNKTFFSLLFWLEASICTKEWQKTERLRLTRIFYVIYFDCEIYCGPSEKPHKPHLFIVFNYHILNFLTINWVLHSTERIRFHISSVALLWGKKGLRRNFLLLIWRRRNFSLRLKINVGKSYLFPRFRLL
jgi:hypothetical protein